MNPLIEIERGRIGWYAALLKCFVAFTLFVCTAFIKHRRGHVPVALTWLLRAAVIEYAIAVLFTMSELTRWFLR